MGAGEPLQVGFPFRIDGAGRAAGAGEEEHIRQLIEQLLFTAPGERVNRPDFGCGLLAAVFGAAAAPDLAALRFTIREAMERWLGELVETREVVVEQRGNRLHVVVSYVERRAGERREASFEVAAE